MILESFLYYFNSFGERKYVHISYIYVYTYIHIYCVLTLNNIVKKATIKLYTVSCIHCNNNDCFCYRNTLKERSKQETSNYSTLFTRKKKINFFLSSNIKKFFYVWMIDKIYRDIKYIYDRF